MILASLTDPTPTQMLAIGFTVILFVIVAPIGFLIFKSIKDDRAYHSVDLPDLAPSESEENEALQAGSAFDVEEDFTGGEQEAFFSVDDDGPMFDFGKDEENIPNMMDDDEGVAVGKKTRRTRKEKPVKKTRKERKNEQVKAAEDRALVEEIIRSTAPEASFDPVNPLNENPIENEDNVFGKYEPAPAPAAPKPPLNTKRDQSGLPVFEEDFLKTSGEKQQEAEYNTFDNFADFLDEDEDPDYVSPTDFLAQRGVSIQEKLAMEEDDDDFTPVIVQGASAFGSDGLHDFELKETSEDKTYGVNNNFSGNMNVRIPARPEEGQTSNYVGKRRRDIPVDSQE